MNVTNERKHSEGYGVVELVVVLMCATILASIAVPNIGHLQKNWAVLGDVRMLEASLQWGRMHSISANTPVQFEVDAGRQRFRCVDPLSGDLYAGTQRQLSNGVQIVSCPKRPLRFYQHGNAVPAGTYTLSGNGISYSVVVSPGGRIRVQKN